MAKKIQIFDALMEGFQDAIARKKGHKVALRVTEIPRVRQMRPRQIRRIRLALGASQSVFAHILNVSPKVVQSWEHGARRPTNAALKLLSIAENNPQILLQSEMGSSPRPGRRTSTAKNSKEGLVRCARRRTDCSDHQTPSPNELGRRILFG
jgi:putative transcriptional regulator